MFLKFVLGMPWESFFSLYCRERPVLETGIYPRNTFYMGYDGLRSGTVPAFTSEFSECHVSRTDSFKSRVARLVS